MQLAVDGAKLLKRLASETEGDFSFEYSPESFHGTEVDYAVDVCNAVLDVWEPDAAHKAIINIPATVETAMPDIFCNTDRICKQASAPQRKCGTQSSSAQRQRLRCQ